MREKFSSELKVAMKASDKRRVDTIRMIMAALKDKEIEARGQGKTLSNEDILALLQKMTKSRKESQEIYEKAGRLDLSTQEAEEISVINSFLPQQLSGSEVEAAIAETGASSVKDMGKVRCAEGAICGADGFCDCQRAREGDPWRVRVRDCL